MKKLFAFFLALISSAGIICASNTYVDGIWYDFNSSTLTASVTYKGPSSISFSNEYSGSIVIPSSVMYNSNTYTVTSIGGDAFFNCPSLTSVTIPNSVTSIGNSAFEDCFGLTSVTIPNSITSIGNNAFYNCTSLTSVTIGNSVTSIGNYAFGHCSGLTSVTIPNSVTSIGSFAFVGCFGLTSVTIPNSVTSIGEEAFYRVANIVYSGTATGSPWGARSINGYVDGWLVYSDYTKTNLLACSSLATGEIVIPNSVTSIGSYAFYDCSGLTSVTIPNSVTSIGNCAFFGCSGLTSVTIGNSVTSIGNKAFYNCSGLTSIEILTETPPSLGGSLVFPNNYTYVIYVPCRSKDAYLTEWNEFASIIRPHVYSFDGRVNSDVMGYLVIQNDTCDVVASATPNYGYHFVQWSDSMTDNPRTIVLTQDTTFTAEFAKNTYALTVNNNNPEMGEVLGDTIANYLDSITISSTPNYGYHFVQWSDSMTDNPRTIVLTQDTTLSAEFAKNAYTITTSANNSAWGEAEGDTTALYLDQVKISATPKYGYHFSQWSDGNTDNPRTIILTKDTAFTAEFAKNIYSITKHTQAEQGSIAGPAQAEFLDSVQILAISNPGYHFVQWSDSVTDNPRTIVLTQDTTFAAEFAQVYSGQCGDELYWAYEDNTLTFSGSGNMYEYTPGTQPWHVLQSEIAQIVFSSEMTSIGDYAFAGVTKIKQINVPNEVEIIGAHAFDSCIFVTSIYLGYQMAEIGDYAFRGCIRVNDITSMNTTTPVVYENTLTSISQYAYLYVPADSKRTYQLDPYWSRFDIQEIVSEEAELTSDEVTVEANDDNAIFTWPIDDNAATYSLQITKDSIVFCTLVFNANGQLIGIAFAPGRENAPYAQTATTSVSGMSFTVTGLNSASAYMFQLDAADSNKQIIKSYTGGFVTEGYEAETYVLTLAVNNSEMGYVTGSGTYEANSQVTIKAVPAIGYKFLQWSNGSKANPYTFNLTEDLTLTATFQMEGVANTYTITVLSADDSMGSVTGGDVYDEGETAVLEAIPNTGYRFTRWNDGNTDNPRNVVVTKNATYIASFEKIEDALDTVEANDNANAKVLINGVLYILRDGKVYTTTGQEVE